jgi:hypothetical protein
MMDDEKSKSMFTEKARNKLRSPDDLNEYLRVTSPRMWIVLAACASLVIGLFVWANFGAVDVSVDAQGAAAQDGVVCFLPEGKMSDIHVGNAANVDGSQLAVASISSKPISREEARKMLGDDYLTNALVTDDWSYVVLMDGDAVSNLEKGVPLSVTITAESLSPINLISKDAA